MSYRIRIAGGFDKQSPEQLVIMAGRGHHQSYGQPRFSSSDGRPQCRAGCC